MYWRIFSSLLTAPSTKPPPTPENELMTNMHTKVTKYILKQVDIQLEKLGETCNTDNVRTTDHNIATQTSCSKQNIYIEATTQTTENDVRDSPRAVTDKKTHIYSSCNTSPYKYSESDSSESFWSTDPLHTNVIQQHGCSETTYQQLCDTKSGGKFEDTMEREF